MKYIKKLNIDFDQWSELNNNSGWYNMELNKTIDYYINKYPVGTKVRIRKDSLYYKENTNSNPKDTIGEIYRINPDELDLQLVINDNFIFDVIWPTGYRNSYSSYRVFDLEYYKEY